MSFGDGQSDFSRSASPARHRYVTRAPPATDSRCGVEDRAGRSGPVLDAVTAQLHPATARLWAASAPWQAAHWRTYIRSHDGKAANR